MCHAFAPRMLQLCSKLEMQGWLLASELYSCFEHGSGEFHCSNLRKIALPDLTSQNPQTPEPKPDTKIIHPPTCPVPWPDAISITPNGTRMMAERIRTPPA